MTTASSHTAKTAPEFIIYSFEKDEVSKGSPVWQIQTSVNDEDAAIEKAESLYASRNFTRVEIRRRELNAATGNWSDQPVHVFDTAKPKIKNALWLMCGALSCVIAAGCIAAYNL